MLVTSRLEELEAIIKDGLEKFVLVGKALREVKDDKLYTQEFETFEEYCRAKFSIGESRAYQLIRSSSITATLTSETLPSRASHVNKLSIIKDVNFRNDAWDDVVDTSEKMGIEIKADLVASFAQKYYVLENDPSIGSDILSGKITPQHGYDLIKTLNRLPDYYREMVMLYGTEIQTDALLELQTLEKQFEDEFITIGTSGWLMGRYNIQFRDLTKRDVQTHLSRLYWERNQLDRDYAIEETKIDSHVVILTGVEIAEKLHEYRNEKEMIYLFPDDVYDIHQLSKSIENGEYGVFCVGVYTKNEPLINKGDDVLKPSELNGKMKPSYLIDAFKATVG